THQVFYRHAATYQVIIIVVQYPAVTDTYFRKSMCAKARLSETYGSTIKIFVHFLPQYLQCGTIDISCTEYLACTGKYAKEMLVVIFIRKSGAIIFNICPKVFITEFRVTQVRTTFPFFSRTTKTFKNKLFTYAESIGTRQRTYREQH